MMSFLKKRDAVAIIDELEQIKSQLHCADNEFNNAIDELDIKAAIFRLCELEVRQSIILDKMRREKLW